MPGVDAAPFVSPIIAVEARQYRSARGTNNNCQMLFNPRWWRRFQPSPTTRVKGLAGNPSVENAMKETNNTVILRAVMGAGVVALLLALAAGCEREQLDPASQAVGDQEGVESEPARQSHQYTMQFDGTDVEVGQAQKVDVQVLPKTDLKINLEFPWSIEIDETDEVELAVAEMDGETMELSEQRATIPVQLTAHQQGRHQVRGRADFSVCNDDRCYIFTDEPVEFVVHATK